MAAVSAIEIFSHGYGGFFLFHGKEGYFCWRYLLGVRPSRFLKEEQNRLSSEKPERNAISLMEKSVVFKRSLEKDSLVEIRY